MRSLSSYSKDDFSDDGISIERVDHCLIFVIRGQDEIFPSGRTKQFESSINWSLSKKSRFQTIYEKQ